MLLYSTKVTFFSDSRLLPLTWIQPVLGKVEDKPCFFFYG